MEVILALLFTFSGSRPAKTPILWAEDSPYWVSYPPFSFVSFEFRKKATQGDLESLIEHYEEPEQSQMLSEIVWAVDNKSAVLIALVDPKCEVAVMVRDIAKGAPVQWTSFPEYAIQSVISPASLQFLRNLEQLADNPSWLAVTLCDLSGVDSLLAALRGLKSVHVSFRLILVLFSLEGIAPVRIPSSPLRIDSSRTVSPVQLDSVCPRRCPSPVSFSTLRTASHSRSFSIRRPIQSGAMLSV